MNDNLRFRNAFVFVLAASSALAQTRVEIIEPEDRSNPQIVKLTLSPAAEPVPALKHSLWPRHEERTPGNAAPYYYRAVLMTVEGRDRVHKHLQEKYGEEFYQEWLSARPEDLPRDGLQMLIRGSAMSELKAAVYREQCDWDLRLRDLRGMDTIAFLLPEVQEMRELARHLSLKAKLEVADGELGKAVETLLLGYKLAQDTAQPKTLVNDLVGIAVAGVCNETLLEIVASPDSPNLYWALAQVPTPLIDLRPAMQYEMQLPLKIFPFLKDPEQESRSPEQWRQFIITAISDLQDLGGDSNQIGYLNAWQEQLVATAIAMKGYPWAKRELIGLGYDRQRVEAMPVGQVIAIHQSNVYRYTYQEMFKWSLLPFWQAQPKMQRSLDKLRSEGYLKTGADAKEILPIVSLLLPATEAASQAGIRLQRDLAALRVIEAIRMHAAGGGKFPKSLGEISVVPVPRDPLTGESFVYELKDGKAMLSLTRPPGSTIRLPRPRVFELSLRNPRIKP